MSQPASPRLFTAYPATTQKTMIQRWGSRNNTRLATEFAESARRLASTFEGEPVDDVILLPYLYLYRHAIELALKEAILLAARIRRDDGDETAEMTQEAVEKRLRLQHGHRLGSLSAECDRHFLALGLQQLPASAAATLTHLSQADRRGEAFRYTGDLPVTWDNIDFPKLHAALADVFSMVMAGIDMLDAHRDLQLEYQEAMADSAPSESDYY